MRVKVTITAKEAVELIVTSEFHSTADKNVTEAFNGPWTITQQENTFTFVHEWSTESPQVFELFAPL
jgi:hypothetical protein